MPGLSRDPASTRLPVAFHRDSIAGGPSKPRRVGMLPTAGVRSVERRRNDTRSVLHGGCRVATMQGETGWSEYARANSPCILSPTCLYS